MSKQPSGRVGSSKGPFDFIEVTLVISGVRRYFLTFGVVFELYRVLSGGGGGPKTGVF